VLVLQIRTLAQLELLPHFVWQILSTLLQMEVDPVVDPPAHMLSSVHWQIFCVVTTPPSAPRPVKVVHEFWLLGQSLELLQIFTHCRAVG